MLFEVKIKGKKTIYHCLEVIVKNIAHNHVKPKVKIQDKGDDDEVELAEKKAKENTYVEFYYDVSFLVANPITKEFKIVNIEDCEYVNKVRED